MLRLARTTIAIALLLALMLFGTIIGARSASAQYFTGGPSYMDGVYRPSGVHTTPRAQVGNPCAYFAAPSPCMPSGGPYRAINHNPATGRTYAREADYLTPKHRVPKRKTR